MPKAVLDTTVLVSAFLNPVPRGASHDLLGFAEAGTFDLHISEGILAEVAGVLLRSSRSRARLAYADADVAMYCRMLLNASVLVLDIPEIRVVRDPNDDMILACALAASADYLVSRDKDLLSIGEYGGVKIVAPEAFLGILRQL